jgi:branched-chain amino acid transport system substrate-binding protein
MQEQKRSIVIFTYLGIFSFIVPAIFWFISSRSGEENTAKTTTVAPSQEQATPSASAPSSKPDARASEIAERMSKGEKILVAADRTPNKETAVEAFASGNYPDAITNFDASLKVKRNDPEAWIYKNNANAIASKNSVKIAVIVPIGSNLNVSKEILRGVAQIQEEVNSKGGIKGKLLEVAIANDDNDPAIAQKIASNLSKDERVLGVIGHNSTEASVAAAPIYQDAKLVMISPTTVGSNLSGIGSYIFRTTPDTRSTADILARHVVQSARKKKVAICLASEAKASQSFKDAFEWSLSQVGGKVVKTNCDFSQPDFNAANVSSEAISNGAEALLLAPSIYNVNQAVAVIQANKKRLPLLGNQTMYVFETLQQGSADANGTILAVAWHPVANANNFFTKETKTMWGGSVGWRTAMAYDATKAIVMGLESGATREQIQATIANPNFTFGGATGTVEFLPSGDRNLKGVLVRVESGKQSGAGYDFVPVK